MKEHNYFVYIVTNQHKTVLYIGVTNDLPRRITEHYNGKISGFTQKYKCKHLVYYERFNDINQAISREKQLKNWRREKKIDLISKLNPEWKFLNESVFTIENEYL